MTGPLLIHTDDAHVRENSIVSLIALGTSHGESDHVDIRWKASGLLTLFRFANSCNFIWNRVIAGIFLSPVRSYSSLDEISAFI